MAGFTIFAVVQSDPPALIRGMGRAMDKAALESARLVRDTAKGLVPVDTGALRRSIRTEKVQPRQYDVGAGEDYAGFVEFGTIHQAAQPYLRPALRINESPMRRIFQAEGGVVLRRDYL